MVYSVENFHIFSNAEVLRLLINSASGRLVQKKIISKNIKFLIFWYSEQALFLYLLVTTSMTIFKSLSFPLKVLTSCAQFFTGSFCFVVKKIAFFFPCHELQRIVLFKCLHTNYVSDQSNTSYIRSR